MQIKRKEKQQQKVSVDYNANLHTQFHQNYVVMYI